MNCRRKFHILGDETGIIPRHLAGKENEFVSPSFHMLLWKRFSAVISITSLIEKGSIPAGKDS